MSTTTDRSVAIKYSTEKADKSSMVFEIQMGMVDRGASIQWCSQFPAEEEILFAPLTGLEVIGTPRVDEKTLVVELRLNTNLRDLTIEQVTAKMKKTHTDLIHTIKMDMKMLGFSDHSLGPLQDHYKEYAEPKENSIRFNNSNFYKQATDAVIAAKLDVCCNAIKLGTGATDLERKQAQKILFNPDDAAALAKGITIVLSDGRLLKQHISALEAIADRGILESLDLTGSELQCALPKPVLRLLGNAMHFNMDGNSFSNVKKGTALYDMVYRMNNWRDRKEIVWKKDQGGGEFESLPHEIGLFRSLESLDVSQNKNLAGE